MWAGFKIPYEVLKQYKYCTVSFAYAVKDPSSYYPSAQVLCGSTTILNANRFSGSVTTGKLEIASRLQGDLIVQAGQAAGGCSYTLKLEL